MLAEESEVEQEADTEPAWVDDAALLATDEPIPPSAYEISPDEAEFIRAYSRGQNLEHDHSAPHDD